MMPLVLLEKRITDLQHEIINDEETKQVQNEAIDILYWVKNAGEMKTLHQIDCKILRIKEELLAYDSNSVQYKERIRKLQELQNVKDFEQ